MDRDGHSDSDRERSRQKDRKTERQRARETARIRLISSLLLANNKYNRNEDKWNDDIIEYNFFWLTLPL